MMTLGIKRKILIIEDIPENAFTLKEMLEGEFNIIIAYDGATGIERAGTDKPDLIICDIMMPTFNGFQVLDKIRENAITSTIPFIFLSAKSDINDIRKGMVLGADDYITKPINKKDLLKTINVRLAKKQIYEKKLDELRTSISYSLPHELKTPLVSILGFSQIIKNDVNNLSKAEIGDMADIIYNSAYNLNGLIQKILLFNKLELISSDQTQLEIFRSGFVNINTDLIAKTSYLIAQRYKREEDLYIDVQVSDLRISEPNLNTLLDELVDNAFKFSSQGNKVTITGNEFDRSYNFYIINDGMGMTNDQIAHLGGYFQINRILYEQPGVGLGLAISKKIIELHSGEFKIESIPLKKTMISFSIPLKKINTN